ncbi:hypothetical protein DFJ73DRAFT_863828 [Zopfochytrium polystomum]|nr:hypothetical protein DFJ73DRAFT_863828 [Zopfochytrium polystomum]
MSHNHDDEESPASEDLTMSDEDGRSQAMTQHGVNAGNRVTIAIIGTAGRGTDGARMTATAIASASTAETATTTPGGGAKLFAKMVEAAERIIAEDWSLPWRSVNLVSGGAAWSDHVAVHLFMSHPSSTLTLHLNPFLTSPPLGPSFLDTSLTAGAAAATHDRYNSTWRTNPGRTANRHHRRFSVAVGRDTLAELGSVISPGAPTAGVAAAAIGTQSGGFHARNTAIAESARRMIAFSWAAAAEAALVGSFDVGGGDGPASVAVPQSRGTRDAWEKCRGVKVVVWLDELVD